MSASKICISLPSESLAQLEYLAYRWGTPPLYKRSQLIQQAIWHAYSYELSREAEGIPPVSLCDVDTFLGTTY